MTINFDTTTYENLIDNFGKTISREAATKTTDNVTGDETLSYAAASNITGTFFKKSDEWMQDKQGLLEGADAVLMVKNGVTIAKDDRLTYDSEEYLVQDVITRRLGTSVFYVMARCFKND